MKKITFKLLFALAFMLTATWQVRAEVTYCNDFGQTLSDNSRGWAATNFTVLGTTTSIDVKQGGAAIIAAGDFYRGVANATAVNVFQNKAATIVLDKTGASFNWIHFAAYADWNADGIFDPITELLFYDGINTDTNRTNNITVPATATLGQTRIRIIMGWFIQNTNNTLENYYSPCLIFGSTGDANVPKNGRAFDFLVNVQTEASAVKATLQAKITEATTLKATTTEGTAVFNYAVGSKASLQTAIDAAQLVYDNPSATEGDITTATATLTAAINAYKATKVMPFKVSDGTTTVWYQVHDKRPTFDYWNIATVGATPNALNITTVSDPGANSQLFKFVKAPAPNMGYYIYSKTDETNALAAPAPANGSLIFIDAAQPATSWILDAAQAGYYIIKTESNSKQLNSYTTAPTKMSFWDGGSTDVGNNWTFVEEILSRTVTVSSSNALLGSAVITGTANTSVTSNQLVSVTATPTTDYFLVNWTNASGGAVVSTDNPYVYGTGGDITLVANFATNGTAVAVPVVSTIENPIYYLIHSASDGSVVTSSFTGDFRSNVLISPVTDGGQLIRNTLASATTADHALWAIVDDAGVVKLKNKATEFYVEGKTAKSIVTDAFTYVLISGNQYYLKNATTNYLIAWKNSLCDLWSSNVGANSLTAWSFVTPTNNVPTGLNINKDVKYTVYEQNARIHISSPSNEQLEIAVYSIAGQSLYRVSTNQQSVVLDKNFSSGAYFVKINQTVSKVIVR